MGHQGATGGHATKLGEGEDGGGEKEGGECKISGVADLLELRYVDVLCLLETLWSRQKARCVAVGEKAAVWCRDCIKEGPGGQAGGSVEEGS